MSKPRTSTEMVVLQNVKLLEENKQFASQLLDTQRRLQEVEQEYAEYVAQAQQEMFGLEGRLLVAISRNKALHDKLSEFVLDQSNREMSSSLMVSGVVGGGTSPQVNTMVT
eukprot:PhF_6_TR12451/c0_g1_i1/m.19600